MSQIPSVEEPPQAEPIQPEKENYEKPLPYVGPRTPQEWAIVICAFGIIGTFFAPWLRTYDGFTNGYTFYHIIEYAKVLWLIPMLAGVVIVAHRREAERDRIGTATALLTVIFYIYFRIQAPYSAGRPAWGSALMMWFCLGLFAFCGKQRITAPVDFVARRLRSRKAEIFSHWGTLTPDRHFSTREFYSALESSIKEKQWPGVDMERIEYREAGMLSHKRDYLRVIRQRQVFDVCAATFGKDYFFTVREAQIPTVVDGRAVLALLAALYLVFGFCVRMLGWYFGSVATIFAVTFGIWFLFNVLKMGLSRVDSMLIQLPAIGPIYEAWFRRDTYFQQDTRIIFLQCVNQLVKEHVEEATSAQGLKHLDCFESQPIMDRVYRRYRKRFDAEEVPVVLSM